MIRKREYRKKYEESLWIIYWNTLVGNSVFLCVRGIFRGGKKRKNLPGSQASRQAPSTISGLEVPNTGNQAEDKELARARAMAQISSEIYASVESSLDINVTGQFGKGRIPSD